MASAGAHNVATVKAAPRAAVPLGAFVCQICNVQSADEFCCCRFPVVLLCKSCQLLHFQKAIGEAHLFMPADFKAKMTSLEEVTKLRQALFNLSDAKGRIVTVLGKIAHCQETIKSRKEQFLLDYSDYVAREIDQLEALKMQLSTEVEKAVDKTRDQLLQPSVTGDDLTVLLWKATKGHQIGNFDLFSYSSCNSAVDLGKLVGVSWKSKVDSSGKLGDNFAFRNPLSQREAATEALIQQEFNSKEELLSAAKDAFGELIPDQELLEEATNRLILAYYEAHYACLKAKEEALEAEIDPGTEVSSWISRVVDAFREKTPMVARRVIEHYLPHIKEVAERRYMREIAALRPLPQAPVLPDPGTDSERITALERLIADLNSRLTDLSLRPAHIPEEHNSIHIRDSLAELEGRLEGMEETGRETGNKLREISQNCTKQYGNVKKLVDDVRESARSGLLRVETAGNEQLQALSARLDSEIAEKSQSLADISLRLSSCEDKSLKSTPHPGLKDTSDLSKDLKSLTAKTQSVLDNSDKALEQIKADLTLSLHLADIAVRKDIKTGRHYVDINETENFFNVVVAQIKTDFQRRVSALQTEAVRTSRLWGLCADLLAALSRTRVSEEAVGSLEALLHRLMGETELMEEAYLLCNNFAAYIREAPICSKTDEQITEIILRLEKCSFDTNELKDTSSLPYLLTRPNRLPLDLKALLPDSTSQLLIDAKPMLMEVRPDHIRLFNCSTSTWSKKIVLNTTIRVDHRSSALVLPNTHIFICGGSGGSEWLQDAYEIDALSGVAGQLRSMLGKRGRHGLVLYYNWVYVFGGWNGAAMRNSERYSLLKETWETISDMINPRDSLTPAIYKHIAYLCGGSSTIECESFDFALGKFSPLGFILPETGYIRSIVLGTDLLLLSDSKMTRRSLISEGVCQEFSHPGYRANGSMSPIVLNTDIWCLTYSANGAALCICGGTGELLKEVAYPS